MGLDGDSYVACVYQYMYLVGLLCLLISSAGVGIYLVVHGCSSINGRFCLENMY